eukprot:NODE_578_length_5822_cov_0.814957.p2 type:complete len:230 gc:universal NODE_578_length_5822_cov_0.814957:2019-1330(-)
MTLLLLLVFHIYLDTEWYINQQLFPPIQRLVYPIEDLDIHHIASIFGMDYKGNQQMNYSEQLDLYVNMEFKQIPITCQCYNTYQVTYFLSSAKENPLGFICNKCKQELDESKVYNLVLSYIRAMVKEYYSRKTDSGPRGRFFLLNHQSYVTHSNSIHMTLVQLKRAFDASELKKLYHKLEISKRETMIRYLNKYDRCCTLITKQVNFMIQSSNCNEIPLGQLFAKAGFK